MCRANRARLIFGAVLVLVSACAGPPVEWVEVPGKDGAFKTAAALRAERRAFDGAPPTIPHQNFGMTCTECHDLQGMEVEGVGFAPPSPHAGTLGMSAISRCQQCHVFSSDQAEFVGNTFAGLRQDGATSDPGRRGRRLNDPPGDFGAPPTLPHQSFMRENCTACHSGPAAREEIRTGHPERANCRQCHLVVTIPSVFIPSVFTPSVSVSEVSGTPSP